MTDLIYKHDILSRINPLMRYTDTGRIINDINTVPEVKTIDGYSIDDLVKLSAICKAANIAPEEVPQLLNNMERIIDIVYQEHHRMLEDAIRRILHNDRP